jgi:hypothetical protein
MVNRALEGWVSPASFLSDTVFYLSIPTSGFVVDEEAARREEGESFAEAVPDDARAGTLHNMLGPAVLDAQSYPSISVRSVSVEAAPSAPPSGAQPGGVQPGSVRPGSVQATVRVSVAGHESSLAVPFVVDASPGRLHAQAVFTVRQTALGLTPFSIFLGALRVEDEMRVKLDLVAIRD